MLYASFLDLEKAYNKVDREALWSVWKIYGVGGQLLTSSPRGHLTSVHAAFGPHGREISNTIAVANTGFPRYSDGMHS